MEQALIIIFGALAVVIGITFMVIAVTALIEGFAQIKYLNEECKLAKIKTKKAKEEYQKLVKEEKKFDSFGYIENKD